MLENRSRNKVMGLFRNEVLWCRRYFCSWLWPAARTHTRFHWSVICISSSDGCTAANECYTIFKLPNLLTELNWTRVLHTIILYVCQQQPPQYTHYNKIVSTNTHTQSSVHELPRIGFDQLQENFGTDWQEMLLPARRCIVGESSIVLVMRTVDAGDRVANSN